jgi:methanogenic corrinoid protein MtbC1
MNDRHTISEVSRIAGIPKDLLRMWERRYNYPKPDRDNNGDRIYTNEQLDKLILIRQLVEQGKRPGKLMAMDLPQLRSLQQVPKTELDVGHLVALLKAGDMIPLRHWFQSRLVAHGLRAFIHNIMAPATLALGAAWSNGELEIYEEHLYTELMKSLVRQSLAEHYREDGEPRVMLTTVQGEQHSLGLLMVEALLRIGGADVIPFGTEMPARDIREAASRQNADVIGLSFSCHFKAEDAIVMLSGLRQIIDPGIRIWVGGAAFDNDFTMPEGVELLDGLHDVERVLAEWNRKPGG